MQTHVVQKVLVTDSHKRILMLRRSKTDVRRPLQWDLPGGMWEKNEGLIDSIKRELKEEANINGNDFFPIYSRTEARTWRESPTVEKTNNVVFIFYTAKCDDTNITLSYEHSEFQWKLLKMAIKDFKYPLHIDCLRYILDNQLLPT